MKKKLLALIVVVMMVFALVACGNGGGTGETGAADDGAVADTADDEEDVADAGAAVDTDVTLTLVMIGDGTLQGELDRLLEGFTAETGIGVETIFIHAGWGEYVTRVQTMVGGGEQVDVIIMAIEGVARIIELGLPVPLDDWIAANADIVDPILADTNPYHQDIFRDAAGNTYSFPFSWNNVVMHFNMDRLEEAGLDLPPANWSIQDFIDYAGALTVEEGGQIRYGIAIPHDQYFVTEAWLIANGASYMNEDFTEATINSPAAIEIWQMMQDLIHVYGYAPIPEPNVSTIEQLMNGQVAMGSWGRWPTANYLASDFHQVAVQFLPTFSVDTQIVGVDGFFVMQTSDYIAESKQLLSFLSTREFAREYLSVGNIPALISLAEEEISALGLPQNAGVFYEDALTATFRPVSSPPQFVEINTIVLTAISEILINQADVQETMDQAAADMNAILEANR